MPIVQQAAHKNMASLHQEKQNEYLIANEQTKQQNRTNKTVQQITNKNYIVKMVLKVVEECLIEKN